jgi:hypothetical protein
LTLTDRGGHLDCVQHAMARDGVGKPKLTAALKTYEVEVARILDRVLSREEQHQMRDYVSRLLTSIDQAEAT